MVEDSEDDALLLLRELRRGGCDLTFERVDTPEAMKAALDKQRWDVIISDYVMPHFSGPDALALLKEKGLDLPFIIVSGKVGEGTAVEAMKAGAHDYIVKGNLARLCPAIERELREAAVRREQMQAEAEAQANAARIEQLEQELRSLNQLSVLSKTAVTAQTFGSAPLREGLPEVFNELVLRYGDLMDKALEQRAYKVEHDISERLRAIAEQIGFLKAGPRDVVEIHTTTLKGRTHEVTPAKAAAYVEEGRLMLLELMGYLTSFYRVYSSGVRK